MSYIAPSLKVAKFTCPTCGAVAKSLDIVRVIGNEQVHPGQIDLRDDHGVAVVLFELANLIVEYLVTNPKKIGAIFASLPTSAKQQIEKRDGKN